MNNLIKFGLGFCYAILLGMQNQWMSKMEEYFNFTPPKNDVFSNSVYFSSISSALRAGTTPESDGFSGGCSGGFSGGGAGGGGGGGF